MKLPSCAPVLLADDLEAFRASEAPKKAKAAPVLVGSIDSISTARRDVATLLDDAGAAREDAIARAIGVLGGLANLSSHAILDGGRIVGLWEYDVDAGAIVWASFVGRTKAIAAAVERTERYVRDELGDARSYGLDSPKSRAHKLAYLRSL
ncbi:MAG TPA: hypothetical protein VN033_02665 [Vulgatibacter sp.]|nr:hypothetical protein [Vulgatibacter sp.]